MTQGLLKNIHCEYLWIFSIKSLRFEHEELHQFKICCCKADAKNFSSFLHHQSVLPSLFLSFFLFFIHLSIILSFVICLGFWMSLFGQTVESRQDIIGRERDGTGFELGSPRVHSIILSFLSVFLPIHHQSVHCSVASSIVLSVVLFIYRSFCRSDHHPSIHRSFCHSSHHPSIHRSFCHSSHHPSIHRSLSVSHVRRNVRVTD